MSILDLKYSINRGKIEFEGKSGKIDPSQVIEFPDYNPSKEDMEAMSLVKRCFQKGYLMHWKARREFNDLSLITRGAVDQMGFNNYIPNDGDSNGLDLIQGWKSNAQTPVIRNKIISIAAHATENLIFPKVFSWNQDNEEEKHAGIVFEDLMEFTGQKYGYDETMLKAIITALWSPISIVHTGYYETYVNVKRPKEDGTHEIEKVLDENRSGFLDEAVPYDELFIPNAYENDIQKQDWVIWRSIKSYDSLHSKYANIYENFKYVKPGVQCIQSNPNQMFYMVYDMELNEDFCEEIRYYNKDQDLFLVFINGVLVTPNDNYNPRYDKLYPFAVTGYEYIDEGKFFWYKSLASKMMQDAKIINTLYRLIIDGTFLQVMPSMIQIGGEAIGADVMIPGSIHTIADPNASVQTISGMSNIGAAQNTLSMVKGSIEETSTEPMQQGISQSGSQTAYEISKLDQASKTVLGIFLKMIIKMVKQYGTLRLGDICQYYTLPMVSDISGAEITYKAFLMPNKGNKTRKIEFTGEELPEKDSKEALYYSGNLWEKEKKAEKDGNKMELYKVDPVKFRKLKYQLIVTPDIITPKSENLQKVLNLELFDRAIQLQSVDQEALVKELLFSSYDKTKKNPEQFLLKKDAMASIMQGAQQMKSPVTSGATSAAMANTTI